MILFTLEKVVKIDVERNGILTSPISKINAKDYESFIFELAKKFQELKLIGFQVEDVYLVANAEKREPIFIFEIDENGMMGNYQYDIDEKDFISGKYFKNEEKGEN